MTSFDGLATQISLFTRPCVAVMWPLAFYIEVCVSSNVKFMIIRSFETLALTSDYMTSFDGLATQNSLFTRPCVAVRWSSYPCLQTGCSESVSISWGVQFSLPRFQIRPEGTQNVDGMWSSADQRRNNCDLCDSSVCAMACRFGMSSFLLLLSPLWTMCLRT